MTDVNIIITEWNVQSVKQAYYLPDDKAELITKNYKDADDFEARLMRFMKDYNATRKDGINTLVAWAVTSEASSC